VVVVARASLPNARSLCPASCLRLLPFDRQVRYRMNEACRAEGSWEGKNARPEHTRRKAHGAGVVRVWARSSRPARCVWAWGVRVVVGLRRG